MLTKFKNIFYTKRISSQNDANQRERLPEDALEDPQHYRSLVGKLVYLTVTRPDLTYVVNRLRQQMSKPTYDDLKAVHQTLRYIKSSHGIGLLFPSCSFKLPVAFADSD